MGCNNTAISIKILILFYFDGRMYASHPGYIPTSVPWIDPGSIMTRIKLFLKIKECWNVFKYITSHFICFRFIFLPVCHLLCLIITHYVKFRTGW